MKKILSLFALLLIIPTFVFAETADVYYTNENGIEMTYEEYEHLINLGFDDLDIQFMTKDEFMEHVNATGEVIATNEKYYKVVGSPIEGYQTYEVSENEYLNSDSQNQIVPFVSSYHETTYKKLTTNISTYNSNYRYQVALEWKNIPATRSYDIIGIGYDSNVVQKYQDVHFQEYISYVGGGTDTWTTYAPQSFTFGEGASFPLPVSTTVGALTQKFWFLISKKTNSSSVILRATGDYKHATSSVSYENSRKYEVNAAGIDLNSSVSSYYDSMTTASVTTTVNW